MVLEKLVLVLTAIKYVILLDQKKFLLMIELISETCKEIFF